MNAKNLYQLGSLREAVAAMNDEVKRHPTDTGRRGFLAELLCFTGELERADKQLDLLVEQDPQIAVGLALFRQLIRAEQARQQLYAEGRVPEFVDEPTPLLQLHLEATIRLRENHASEAAELLRQAEEQRPRITGTCDGKAFDDFRDLDDLTAGFFEVLTSTGKYYWIPAERVEHMELHPPARPRDLYWRRVHMSVSSGPDGEVFLPTLYPGSHQESDDQLRLGRSTDWKQGAGFVRGVGQRTFLVGEQDRTILELKEVEFGAH